MSMANSNQSFKNYGNNIGPIVGLISAATPLVISAIDKLSDHVQDRQSQKALITENLIKVPELYTEGFPVKVDEAQKILELKGFNVILSPLSLQEARIDYRACEDGQVIATNPESNSYEKSGEVIVVRYISQEVIDESRRMYEESEKLKAEKSKNIKKVLTVAADVACPPLGLVKIGKSLKDKHEKLNNSEEQA